MRGAGSVWQRKDGVWAAAISLGVANGKRARETVYGPTQDAVEAKLDRLRLVVGSGDGLPSKVPLGDFLDSWIDRAARDLAPKTVTGYRSILGDVPAWLRAVPLGKLNGGHVQRWVDELAGAPRTVASKRNTLRAALNDARRRGLVTTNAAALARAPKQRRPKRTVLGSADCRAILDALDVQTATDDTPEVPRWRYQAAAALAIGTGLRQGELLGLAWPDLAGDVVTVRASLSRVAGEYVRAATKTEASEAVVPIPAFVLPYLAAWDEVQAKEWREAHPDGKPVDIEEARKAGLVFTTEKGMPVHGSVVTHQFQARLVAAKLRKIVWHDLRHATADLLADAGIGQTVARDYMRHASYATTADHYTGSGPEALRLAARAIDAAMGRTG